MTKKPTTFALRGAVCFSTDSSHLTCLEDAYLVCQNGLTIGVYPQLPEQFHGIPCEDFNNCLIVPGMNDLHLHAPQYAFHGMYMDLELLEWLNTVTFPEEARYSDLNYAEKAYSIFADDLKKMCDHTSFHLRHLTCRCNRTSDGPYGENRTKSFHRQNKYGPERLQGSPGGKCCCFCNGYCPLAK